MLLGIVIILIVGYLASRAIKDARSRSWAGPRTAPMRTRAAAPKARTPGRGKSVLKSAGSAAVSAGSAVVHPSNSAIRAQAKADAHRLWTEVSAADWLEQRRHDRQNGTAPAPPAAGTVTAARPTIAKRLRLWPFVAEPASPASGGSDGARVPDLAEPPLLPPAAPVPAGPGPARPPVAERPPERTWAGPETVPEVPPPAPLQEPPSSNPGGTVAAGTSTASAEKAIEGVNEIYAHGMAGGIHAKQEALKAFHELAVRAAQAVVTFSRQMSEPGSNYGTEITEPLSTAGNHFTAAATTVSEADAAVSTLINMTVGDLATSARQAPHHRELTENGAH